MYRTEDLPKTVGRGPHAASLARVPNLPSVSCQITRAHRKIFTHEAALANYCVRHNISLARLVDSLRPKFKQARVSMRESMLQRVLEEPDIQPSHNFPNMDVLME